MEPRKSRATGYIPPQSKKEREVLNDRIKQRLLKEFDVLDTNDDGFLDAKEVRAYIKKKIKERGMTLIQNKPFFLIQTST